MAKIFSRTNFFPVYPANIGTLFFVAVFFLLAGQTGARGAAPSQKEILKSRIDDLRKQIEIYQNSIDEKSHKEESISNDIEILEADIKKIELQIQETNLQIDGLEGEIAEKEIEIEKMKRQVDAKKEMLAKFLQELYEKGGGETAEIIFSEQSFSDYFSKIESLESFEDQIKEAHDQLEASRDALEDEKENLIERKIDKENLRGIQGDQERTLEREKQMENLLISQIRNEKQALEQNMERLQEELSELQSLGEPINMEEAVKAAKYASGLTGVAPEFLLGVLRVESGLGTNVGGGRYKIGHESGPMGHFQKNLQRAWT